MEQPRRARRGRAVPLKPIEEVESKVTGNSSIVGQVNRHVSQATRHARPRCLLAATKLRSHIAVGQTVDDAHPQRVPLCLGETRHGATDIATARIKIDHRPARSHAG